MIRYFRHFRLLVGHGNGLLWLETVSMLTRSLSYFKSFVQQSFYDTLKEYVSEWAEQAKKCKNKGEYKNYAVIVLERIEQTAKIMEMENEK